MAVLAVWWRGKEGLLHMKKEGLLHRKTLKKKENRSHHKTVQSTRLPSKYK